MSVGGPSGGPVPNPALLDTVEQSLSGSLCVIVRISSTTMSTNPGPYPVSEKAGLCRSRTGDCWRPGNKRASVEARSKRQQVLQSTAVSQTGCEKLHRETALRFMSFSVRHTVGGKCRCDFMT